MTMKVVILSDLHLGSNDGLLGFIAAERAGVSHREHLKSVLLNKLKDATAPRSLDVKCVLVLAGDTLDFSLQQYSCSFEEGQSFFSTLASEDLFDEIVFIAGNHDHNVWQMVQKETAVIDRLRKGEIPREFAHIRGALIDLEAGELVIPNVTNVPEASDSDSFFIQGIFGKEALKRPKFWVVYPNLFIQPPISTSAKAEPILVTHGHFFSLPWVLLTSVFPQNLQINNNFTLEQLEQINSPLTEMAWTALGQAGVLTDVARNIYSSTAKGETEVLQRVIEEFGSYLDETVCNSGWWNPREWATDFVIELIKLFLFRLAEKGIESGKEHKDNPTFIDNKDNQKRIEYYLELSNAQYKNLLKLCRPQWKPEMLQKIVFGHTHAVIKPPQGIGFFPGANNTGFLNTGGFMNDVEKLSATAVLVDSTGKIESIDIL